MSCKKYYKGTSYYTSYSDEKMGIENIITGEIKRNTITAVIS